MILSTTFKIAAATSLDDINTIVVQNEGFHGPLIALDNDGTDTLITVNDTVDTPANPVHIVAQTGAGITLPDGDTLICTGNIFIAGVLTYCSASRA